MAILMFQGRHIEVDEGGYLLNPADWSWELAQHMAQKDDRKLGVDHQHSINAVRILYAEVVDAIKQGEVYWSHKFVRGEIVKRTGLAEEYINAQFAPAPISSLCKYAGVLRSC